MWFTATRGHWNPLSKILHPPLKGVHQGCPLSPLLFSLFISDLQDSLKTKSSGRIKIGDQEVSIIMFADDLVLLADSSKDYSSPYLFYRNIVEYDN